MTKYAALLAPLLTLLMLACDKQEGMGGDSAGDGDGDGDSAGDGDGDGDGDGSGDGNGDGDGDAGDDEAGDGDSTGEGGDETGGDGDCSLGEYVPDPFTELPDWSNLSGRVNHSVEYSELTGSVHYVGARFYTTSWVDESQLCIESIVEPTGIDSCWVFYSQGHGLANDLFDNWYDDLPVDEVSFDLGNGPIVLDVTPANDLNPSSYSAELPAPPAGVPFGQAATLAASFDGLFPIEVDVEIPSDILPLGYALDTTTLSSEELASWTWSAPGGGEPMQLEVTVAASPSGSGWSEWVKIRCEVTDDGEFAFPLEYIDYARERLGSEIYAGATLSRQATGSTMLAGKQLLWRSLITARLAVEVVD